MCSTSWNLKKIRLIPHLLDKDICEVLVCGLVLSYLDYGNGLFFGACDNVIKKFQHVQNFVVKIVLKEDLKSRSIAGLHKLHWLLIGAHINFKMLLMVFKCLRGSKFPCILKNLLVHNKRSGISDNSRSNDGELLIVTYVKYKMFVAQALSVSGPRLWNSLPMDI